MAKSILGAGLVAVDHIFLAEDKGRSPKRLAYLGSAGGGSIPNSLCLLSLLGYKTYIFGATGNDECERIIKEEFRSFGVDCDHLVRKGDRTDLRLTRQFSHLILTDGSHSFKKYCLECGSNFSRDYQISKYDMNDKIRDLAKEAHLLLLDRANKANLSLAQIASQNKRKIAYDLGFNSYGSYLETTKSILKLSNLVQINAKTFEKFMGSIDDSAIVRWWENYQDNDYLLITNGEKGLCGYARIGDERIIYKFDAIPCDHVRDASGAGDIVFAVVTSELLLKQPPSSFEDFKIRVDLGQALASLNCTLYGARALQRAYLNQKVTPKEILETASSIIEKGKSGNSFSPTIGLPKPVSKIYRLSNLSDCKICGSISQSEKEKINRRAKRLSSHSEIPEVLTQVPWTMKTSFLTGKEYRNSILEICRKNALFVGSGGSFSASVFGEKLYLHALGGLARAITPFEFEGLTKIDPNAVVWFLSHGGGNADILGSALNAIKLNHSECIAFTGNKNSKLAELARQHGWETIYIQSQERNFVSIVGLLSQVSALCGILATDEDLRKLDEFFSDVSLQNNINHITRRMESISKEIARNSDVGSIHIVGLARGWGWPALVDLESKLVEGGICTVEISELKNFTHGRYMNLFGRTNRRVILIRTPSDTELADYLYKKLRRYLPTYVLDTEDDGIVGAIDLMIKTLFLTWYLGQLAKINILKPKFPP